MWRKKKIKKYKPVIRLSNEKEKAKGQTEVQVYTFWGYDTTFVGAETVLMTDGILED